MPPPVSEFYPKPGHMQVEPGGRLSLNVLGKTLLYASPHLGNYYCMDINFWFAGANNMEQSC